MGILDKVKNKKPAAKDAPKTEEKNVVKEAQTQEHESMAPVVGQDVLLRPVLSEKGSMQEGQGQYTFVVQRTATKIDVKRAVKEMYNVMPVRVNMIHVQGKVKRFGRLKGRRSDIKKAIVTLKKGEKIDIHEGV